MSPAVIYFILLLSPAVLSRTLPHFEELDEEDKHLYRAAYETPSYNQQNYEEDLPLNKFDPITDGLWMIKAKIKELKAFDKALAANVLATKLRLKKLLKKQLLDAKKPAYEAPSYNYQQPAYTYQMPANPHQNYEPQHYEIQYAAPQAPHAQYAHDPYYGH